MQMNRTSQKIMEEYCEQVFHKIFTNSRGYYSIKSRPNKLYKPTVRKLGLKCIKQVLRKSHLRWYLLAVKFIYLFQTFYLSSSFPRPLFWLRWSENVSTDSIVRDRQDLAKGCKLGSIRQNRLVNSNEKRTRGKNLSLCLLWQVANIDNWLKHGILTFPRHIDSQLWFEYSR